MKRITFERKVNVLEKKANEKCSAYHQSENVSEGLLTLNLAPLTGLEPVTYGLTVRRSTD